MRTEAGSGGGGVGGAGGGVGAWRTDADVQLPGVVETASGWNRHTPISCAGCVLLVTRLNVNAAHAGSATHSEQHAGASEMPLSFRYVVEPRMHVLFASC